MSAASGTPGRPPAAAGGQEADLPWGLIAELATAEELLAAARGARAAGYTRLEAYAPFHVEGLAQAIGFTRTKVPLVTFVGGVVGGVGGYFMQWYSAVVDYAINVGGRPFHSWPMFIPVTFELTILCAAFAAVLALVCGSGLPNLYHPVFNARDFDLATRNRFFLVIRSDDPRFEADSAGRWLDALEPMARSEVPA